MLNAHLDTVSPGCGIVTQCREDDICSISETILGADDKAGITVILAALREMVNAARGLDSLPVLADILPKLVSIPHVNVKLIATIASLYCQYREMRLSRQQVPLKPGAEAG